MNFCVVAKLKDFKKGEENLELNGIFYVLLAVLFCKKYQILQPMIYLTLPTSEVHLIKFLLNHSQLIVHIYYLLGWGIDHSLICTAPAHSEATITYYYSNITI